MPTLFQINVTANWGSTGRIAEEIGGLALERGWQCYMAYGRGCPDSRLRLVRVGSDAGMYWNGLRSRLLDCEGLTATHATRRLVRLMEQVQPDVVHLHNLHGYYLDYEVLFRHLAASGVPVVWTLHDCWPFTGHCAYFDFAGCDRWQTGCHHCPQRGAYPASWLADRSRRNWEAKRRAFTSPGRLTLVPVSDWLGGLLGRSFLAGYPVHRIYNGVDTSVFCPQPSASAEAWRERLGIGHRHVLLGVASVWGSRKGLADFVALRRALLAAEYAIVLVGLTPGQAKGLPEGIVAVPRGAAHGQRAAAGGVVFGGKRVRQPHVGGQLPHDQPGGVGVRHAGHHLPHGWQRGGGGRCHGARGAAGRHSRLGLGGALPVRARQGGVDGCLPSAGIGTVRQERTFPGIYRFVRATDEYMIVSRPKRRWYGVFDDARQSVKTTHVSQWKRRTSVSGNDARQSVETTHVSSSYKLASVRLTNSRPFVLQTRVRRFHLGAAA